MIRRLILPFLLALQSWAGADTPVPVWKPGPVTGDPLFFVKPEDGSPAKATLLLTPDRTPVIRSATLEISYESGRDFTWKPGSRDITLPEGSRIPFKTTAELHPPPQSPNSYKGFRDGKSWMLFGEGRYFHDLQCVAAYASAEDAKLPCPAPAPEAQLAGIRAKLKSAAPVKLVTLGDSISTGANASGASGAPPGLPGYPDLVARGMESAFAVKVTAKNLSVGGMDSAWGLKQTAAVIAEKPDLLILAFGMNDASGRRTPADFAGIIRQTTAAVRSAVPACDVIVVSPMTANSEWIHAAPELYPAYATALRDLADPGCALADVTTLWSAVAARKPYLCLSGNGLNHPNDFGHQLYADVILATLGE
jgi:acyl-CoA thioesterase I